MPAPSPAPFGRRLLHQLSRRRASRPAARNTRLARLEPLEERNLLATFHVVNTDDSGDGSLRQAIITANETPGPDTIRFATGLAHQIQLESQLVITDDLTILGPGADRLAISGGGATRVFAMIPPTMVDDDLNVEARLPTAEDLAEAPRVTIANLSINDGLATGALGFPATSEFTLFAFGGGLYNLGGRVQLDRVYMHNNQARGGVTAGGAVANEFGGLLSVTHSHFEGNLSSGGLVGVGGAITSDLGLLANEDGAPIGTTKQPRVSVDRSSFTDNVAQALAGYVEGEAFSGLGGGGAILNVTGVMHVTRSYFQGNTARGGLGISSVPDLPDSTSGGAGFGGAILSGDFSPFGKGNSRLEVSRSEFVGNSALGGAGLDGSDEGVPLEGGVAAGGAISVANLGDAELKRNTFRRNTAVGGDGGAGASGGVATGGGVSGAGVSEEFSEQTTLKLEHNDFLYNSAKGGAGSTGRGGGLGLDTILDLAGFFPGAASAEVNGDRYVSNVAYGGIGGGIYNEGDLTIEHALLSHNQAVGEADVAIDFVPGYKFVGAALGGGLSNIGVLEMRHTTVKDNVAIGADNASGPNLLLDGAVDFPGLAVGGGLHNITDASVVRSRFIGNQALGGDDNSGSFAGVANGGGVYNDGALAVSHGSFMDNKAAGGDDNTGDLNAGIGVGGGIASGSLSGVRSASLAVEHSSLRGNVAAGGDGNTGLEGVPLPLAYAPNLGAGGGILVYQGTAEIARTSVTHNRAVGGTGGLGAGGGVFFFGFADVIAEISYSILAHNSAIGGQGADGFGGALLAGGLGAGNAVQVSVDHSVIFDNLAKGGHGGDGLGGGIFNDTDSILDLGRSLIFRNRAVGVQGVGGGIYNLNEDETDGLLHALVFANYASTSDDDFFGW